MPEVLRGYEFSRSASRYRDTQTGRFVARRHVVNLLEQQVDRAESRLANIVQGLSHGEIAPGYAQTMMRDELRRLHLQNRALAAGGWDRMSFRDYGAIGGRLKEDYRRFSDLTNDLANGRISLPQALNRVRGYAGNARIQFFEAEKESQRQAATSRSMVLLMIRDLGAAEHCRDCVEYYRQGYQLELPAPGQASQCGTHCRCSMRYREVPQDQAGELIGRRS